MRYFFLREVPFGQDGSYSHEAIVARMNADLANDIGNLAQRSLTMIARNCAGRVPDWRERGDRSTKRISTMLARADALVGEARRAHAELSRCISISAPFSRSCREANRYFANAEPWKLAKSDPARMRLVLYVTIEILRIAAILLQPVMPASMGELLDLLAVAAGGAHFRGARRRRSGDGRLDAPHRLEPGRALPAAGAGLSALRRSGGGEVRGLRPLREPAREVRAP